jgi:hypothetical protein
MMTTVEWETMLHYLGRDDMWHVSVTLSASGREYDLAFKTYEEAALCEAKWILELGRSNSSVTPSQEYQHAWAWCWHNTDTDIAKNDSQCP